MGRKVAWIVSILLLLTTAATGLYSGVNDLAYAKTALQKSVTYCVLLYAIVALAAAGSLVARHRTAVWLSAAWAVIVTYVASTASLAYGGDDVTLGAAIAAGVGAALVGALVIWCARVAIRPASLSERLQAAPGSHVR
jgi:hypothetical protein